MFPCSPHCKWRDGAHAWRFPHHTCQPPHPPSPFNYLQFYLFIYFISACVHMWAFLEVTSHKFCWFVVKLLTVLWRRAHKTYEKTSSSPSILNCLLSWTVRIRSQLMVYRIQESTSCLRTFPPFIRPSAYTSRNRWRVLEGQMFLVFKYRITEFILELVWLVIDMDLYKALGHSH
jgi:hypothetical protein